MAGQYIYESFILRPSQEYIEKTAPPEFLPAYEWFQQNEDAHISALPHRMKPPMRVGGIPISRDSGIYSPSANSVHYGDIRYALSIHSDGNGNYSDRPPIHLEDGTWILDYSAHSSSAAEPKGQNYNGWLMNCLRAGLPVGVMVKERNGGYRVLGLAFVERYNSAARMYTLHGPMNATTVTRGTFDAPDIDELPEAEKMLGGLDLADERKIELVEQVRRERQGKFRDALMRAYAGRCAVTGIDVAEVLQAAHINPYRGKKSQVASNGLLLRADMHLLFDAHLVSIDPGNMRLRLSQRLEKTNYVRYNKTCIAVPVVQRVRPDDALLEVHYEQFRIENKVMN